MSRMNAAWSNEPPWAEAVPAIFKEPMTIAFGGAILAHAIFFLGLPVVAGSEKQPDVQPVATTVLTDQERAAVPADLSQSQFSPGTLLPGSNNGLTVPPIPSTPGGTVTTTPGLGSGFGQLNEPAFSNGGYATGSNSSSNSDFNTRLAEITRQQEAQKAQQTAAEKKKQDAIDKAMKETPPANLPTVVGAMPPGTPQGTPVGEPAKQPEAATPAPSPSPTSEADRKKQIAARFAINTNAENTGPALDKVKFAKAIAVNKWALSRNSKQEKFISKSNKTFSDLYVIWPEEINLPYPKEISTDIDIADYTQKFNAGYGEAVVAIPINEYGNFEFDPEIVQSTGNPNLDAYAIAYVRSLMKESKFGRTIKLYSMKIKITPPPAPAPAS
jgi:outer membrane biosynthesis protein TonB